MERDSSYFVKHHSDSINKVIWNWYLQHAWQQICYAWWMCLSKDSRHTYGYKLCSSSRRIVLLFLCSRLHTGVSVAVLDVFFVFLIILNITIWLTVTKRQWLDFFLRRCFISWITANTFTGLDYISVQWRVSYNKQTLLTCASIWLDERGSYVIWALSTLTNTQVIINHV